MSMTCRDAISRMMRLLGALGSGDEPTAEEMADAMTAFNNLKASWFGTLIGAPSPSTATKTGADRRTPVVMVYPCAGAAAGGCGHDEPSGWSSVLRPRAP